MEKAFLLLNAELVPFHGYFSLMTINTLKLVYFAYLHLISSYGLILWGNSTDRSKVFNTQKKIIRIMASAKTVSYRRLVWRFNILPLASEYIFCLISFVMENLKNISKKYRCLQFQHRI
jgi:hypothetical protein